MKIRFFRLSSLVILLVACTQAKTQIPPSFTPITPMVEFTPVIPTSSPAFTITVPASPSPIPSHTPNPLPTADLSASLTLEGPWLVYINSDDQLTVVNQNGTGITHLAIDSVLPAFRFRGSSSSGVLAVMTRPDQDIAIELFQLPDGKTLRTIPLLSYYEGSKQVELDDGPQGPGGGISGNPIWSPDGQYLAFMGAIEGSSSDLYIYDAFRDTLKRLTYGENQAATPIWSPDGKWIIHEEVTNFHGWSTAGIWAASVDGSEVKLLYKPYNNIQQSILRWIDNSRFIVVDRGMDGPRNIRIVNVETGNIATLFAGYFHDISFDLQSDALAVIPIQGAPGVGPEMATNGIYLISGPGATPVLMVPDAGEVYLANDNYFFSNIECGKEMFIAFTADGKIDCLADDAHNISPNGLWLVSIDNGITLYDLDGNLVADNSDIQTGNIVWRLDSLGFFIVAEKILYYVSVPDFDFQIVDHSSDFYNFTWVDLQ